MTEIAIDEDGIGGRASDGPDGRASDGPAVGQNVWIAAAPSWLQVPADASDAADWSCQIEAQGLGPLAYRWLSLPAGTGSGRRATPPAVRERLAVAYTESLGAWLLRRQGLMGLLDVLAEPPAIPVVVLKGMALAISLYPDPALRPMNDIDVLVPIERIEEAARRMQTSGRRLVSTGRPAEVAIAHGGELFFDDLTSSPPLRIELHMAPWNFMPPHAAAAMVWFWQHATMVRWQEYSFLALDPTAQLLHLAAHLVHHGGSKQAPLLWSFDIHLLCLLRGAEIDWTELLQQARLLEWEAGLHAVLLDVSTIFGVRLPPEVGSWLSKDPGGMAGVATVRNLSLPVTLRTRSVMEALRHRSWSERRRYVVNILLPHPAFMRARYPQIPGYFWPLLYPYRWLDLAADALTTLFAYRCRRTASRGLNG